MRLALGLALLLASGAAALAAPVVVTSGEHKDFTRLVLQFEAAPDWRLGRSLDGYDLRIAGAPPDYDLSRAFDLIGKTRLASLAADPLTGDLSLSIACACHAIPYEFRPGILVIDLYDGPAAPGSSFEQPLSQGEDPLLSDAASGGQDEDPLLAGIEPPASPDPALAGDTLVEGYDWTRLSLQQMGIEAGAPPSVANNAPEAPLPKSLDPGLDRLRETLVRQMGQGATAGLLDLVPPKNSASDAAEAPAEAEAATKPEGGPAEEVEAAAEILRAHLGETPELILRSTDERGPSLTASGAQCVPDEELELATWGAERPIAEQIGPIREGIVGEFDKPSAEAVKRVVRFYLYIGFGAEARALLRSYPDLVPGAEVLDSLALLIDNDPSPDNVFKGMQECETAAALWAVLADPAALPRDEIGRAAVARNFSALPAALRRLLGPRLVDAYLAADELAAATTLSESVLRAPGDPGPEVVMMQAAMDRAKGHMGKAESKLEPLAEAPGPASTDALVDLVEHRAMLGQRVSEEEVMTLESALKERTGSPEELRYRRAVVLAKAASGDFDTAFAEAEDRETLVSIWRLLATSGGDTPLLTHGVLAEGAAPPEEARGAAGLIADRMLMLGLADQAARWLELAPRAPNLLRARIALANGDAQGAMDLVKDEDSQQAMHLRAQALQSLGEDAEAAAVYAEMGKVDAQWSTLSQAQSWDSLSKDGPEQWKALAGLVTGQAPEAAAPEAPAEGSTGPKGQLAEGNQLVDESASTRDAITNLLNSVQVPGLPSQ